MTTVGTASGTVNPGTMVAFGCVGIADQILYASPRHEKDQVRTVHRRKSHASTYFVKDHVQHRFQSQPRYSGESIFQFSKLGDTASNLMLVIERDALKAEEGEGVVPTHFKAPDAGNEVNACANAEEAFFFAYGPATADGEDRAASVVTNREAYYAATENSSAYADAYLTDVAPVNPLDSDTEPHAYWCNNSGQAHVKNAWAVMGGQTCETLSALSMFYKEELCGKAGKSIAEMTGTREQLVDLVLDSQRSRVMYVPMPFFFSEPRKQYNAAPLCSLVFSGFNVHVQFESLKNLIVQSSASTRVTSVRTGAPPADGDLRAFMENTLTYLHPEERALFSMGKFNQLYKQTIIKTCHGKGSTITCDVRVGHPIIELMWSLRRECQEAANNWFNLSGIDGADPMESASILVNGQLLANKPAEFFRQVMPYYYHSKLPQGYVYSWSFSVDPEGDDSAGSLNGSRTDSLEVQIRPQSGLQNEDLSIEFAIVVWNFIRYSDGLAGPAFQ